MLGLSDPASDLIQRRQYGASILAALSDALDITDTQHERARSAYHTVSSVIQQSANPILRGSRVFPQGSFSCGTVIRPIDEDQGQFDVDLICLLPVSTEDILPSYAKLTLGQPLEADLRYADKLEEKPRCWRIVYAGEFHLDVAPLAIHGPGTAIPDKDLSNWIPTSPEDYTDWFNKLAEQSRTLNLRESAVVAKADVSPFPEPSADKGWLRRIVQLLKRHRDIWAMNNPTVKDFAPISIIITTLAGRALAKIMSSTSQYLTLYDLLEAIVRDMPNHIETRFVHGHIERWVASPVAAENFANRWNQDASWEREFVAWHRDVTAFLAALPPTEGLAKVRTLVEASFGPAATSRAMSETANSLRMLRERGDLRLAVGAGGLTTSTAYGGLPVKDHTFYGD